MCPKNTDAPAVGYLTIKLQNSIWYKCLNLSLTGSRTYVRTHICTEGRTFVRKNEKLYAPSIIRCRGIKKTSGLCFLEDLILYTELQRSWPVWGTGLQYLFSKVLVHLSNMSRQNISKICPFESIISKGETIRVIHFVEILYIINIQQNMNVLSNWQVSCSTGIMSCYYRSIDLHHKLKSECFNPCHAE